MRGRDGRARCRLRRADCFGLRADCRRGRRAAPAVGVLGCAGEPSGRGLRVLQRSPTAARAPPMLWHAILRGPPRGRVREPAVGRWASLFSGAPAAAQAPARFHGQRCAAAAPLTAHGPRVLRGPLHQGKRGQVVHQRRCTDGQRGRHLAVSPVCQAAGRVERRSRAAAGRAARHTAGAGCGRARG